MSSEAVVLKFQGGECSATSCGSKNPVAGAIAMAMLQEANGLSVAQAQSNNVESQLAGLKLASGIQLS